MEDKEFSEALNRFIVKVDENAKHVFADIVGKAMESIVDGSPITGAPGQPVDWGNLRTSWIPEFISPTVAEIVTKSEYAEYVEDGIRGTGKKGETVQAVYKNHGPHSVKLTVAGFQRLVDAAVKDVVGDAS